MSSSRRTLGIVALVCALAASGCASPSTASPASTASTTGALPDASAPLVGVDDIDRIESELATKSSNALERLLVDTGVNAVFPGVLQPVISLDAEITGAGRSFTADLLDLPGESAEPARFRKSRSVGSSGPSDLALMGTGLLSAIIEQALDHAATGSTSSSELPEHPSENHVTVNGGDIDIRYGDSKTTTTLDGATVTLDTAVTGVLGACPTASGNVLGELSVDMTMQATGAAGSAGTTYTMTLVIDGQVDDQARLVGHDMNVSGSASGHGRVEREGSADIEGFFIEGGSTTSFTGTAIAGDLAVASLQGPGITRTSSTVTGDNAQAFIDSQHSIALLLSSLVLHRAEAFWRSGECIDVDLRPSADPQRLDPLQTIELSVNATSSHDAAMITGSVGAIVAAGTATASPPTAPTLPATFSLTAPDDASPSTVDIEVRSRRGIGRSSVHLAGVQGYAVDGALDVFSAAGTKCEGAAGAWKLDLTADFAGSAFNGSVSFDLDRSTLTGQYLLAGTTSVSGVAIEQQASGDVSFVENDDGTAGLIFEGAAWAGGPAGVHSVSVLPTEACR